MQNTRDLLSAHSGNAGKGDADRSPGWRDKYDIPPSGDMIGFTQVGPSKIRKVYPAGFLKQLPRPAEVTTEPCANFTPEDLAKMRANIGFDPLARRP
jgi:hypothetical protein